MGYGQGDYGQGDYGQGDPGFFSFLGHLAKGVVGAASGFLKGGPIGAITGGITGFKGSGQGASGSGGGSVGVLHPMVVQEQLYAPPSTSHTSVGYGLFSHDQSTGGSYSGGGSSPGRYGAPGQPGFHQVRRGPHAGAWVRNRHMNPTNPRALRRAIRRARGFEHLARKVLGFTTPHKPKGRPYFKRTRK